MSNVQLETTWKEALKEEFSKPYFAQIKRFLLAEKKKGHTLCPPGPKVFEALNTTPLPKVRVVILGQDPYHGPGQAHGLSFSVPKGVAIPPSLRNIYKALVKDVGGTIPSHGYLQAWAQQGVLLLNTILTVRQGEAASHRKIGWEHFTHRIIETVSREQEHVVFMLWGSYAKSKAHLIDAEKHLILTAVHPSPLSAHRGFFSCHHFSKANHFLSQRGLPVINWLPLD